jgi:hypothetical protein
MRESDTRTRIAPGIPCNEGVVAEAIDVQFDVLREADMQMASLECGLSLV